MIRSKIAAAFLVTALAVTLGLAAPASRADSDTTYTYTGNPFTTFDGSYACEPVCSITGSFTLAQALPANLDAAGTYLPISYSFTDGLTTITQNNSDLGTDFDYFQTNSSGGITGWDIFVEKDNILLATTTLGTPFDVTLDANSLNDAFNLGDQGTWKTSSATVPEPSSMLLLTSGLGIIAIGLRKRLA
jgi:hypothetical protein